MVYVTGRVENMLRKCVGQGSHSCYMTCSRQWQEAADSGRDKQRRKIQSTLSLSPYLFYRGALSTLSE